MAVKRREQQRQPLPGALQAELERANVLGFQVWITARHVERIEVAQRRVELIGVVGTADARRETQLDLSRGIDVVGDECARKHVA